MIVQFFYFYTRTAVFFRMWTQTGWLVNLSVFLSIGTKKSPDAGIMCGQCPEIFLDIRTKSRSFCTNIRVNFLMFTSTFQLFFRRAAFSGVRAHGKLLQNPELVFSRLLVGIGLAYYQVRLVHDAALYDQPQGGYVEIYLAHLFGCLEEGGQRLETEIADGVETRMRADARDALDFRLRYVRQGAQCIDELS